MFLLVGILAALFERGTSGRGQVVDAAMVDGASSLVTMIYGHARRRALAGPARGQPARRRGALLRHLRLRRRRPRRGRRAGAAVLRGAARGARARPTRCPARQYDVAHWPEHRRRFAEAFAQPDPRRVGRGLRRHRRLRHPGAGPARGAGAPAPGRPRHVRRAGRGRAARPGAAVLPHPGRRPRRRRAGRAPTPARCWRTGASPPTRWGELLAAGAVAERGRTDGRRTGGGRGTGGAAGRRPGHHDQPAARRRTPSTGPSPRASPPPSTSWTPPTTSGSAC